MNLQSKSYREASARFRISQPADWQRMIADGYDVPWLYLEPKGESRTLVVRMRDESQVNAARAAYLAKGKR